MDTLNRPLSVKFSTKNFKGFKHQDILDELKKQIELENVSAIQITETNCVVTLKDETTKHSILSKELSLRDRSITFVEIDKTITNVTIKDTPFELDDSFVYTHMLKYGSVIPGSVKRGNIRGTQIENGSRYLQIVNCAPTLPNRTMFGRFEVRIFADNNRTPCTHCKLTSHPSYRCPDRPDTRSSRKCYICHELGHIAIHCSRVPSCTACHQDGHLQHDCPSRPTQKDRDDFGPYASEIAEGRAAQLEDDSTSATSCATDSAKDELNILLGASNCNRLSSLDEENIVNASISGATLENVDECIQLAKCKTDNESTTVGKVVLCLGTNDVGKNCDDVDEVVLNASQAISKIKTEYPEAHIGICNIIPRRGTGNHAVKLNTTSSSVNTYLQKLCKRNFKLHFIDIASEFYNQDGHVKKTMFDKNDSSGVHIGQSGVDHITSKITDFLNTVHPSSIQSPQSPDAIDRKRNRSELTSTPGSADRQPNKQAKSD